MTVVVARLRTLAFLLLLGFSVSLVGCSADSATPPVGPPFNPLSEPQRVPQLLREELGERVVVRRVTLTDNGFRAEVRDPAKPQNLDTYSFYNGRWETEPLAVSQYDIDRMDRVVFGLGAVDWAVIPRLEDKALAGLDLEDEKVTVVSVDRIEGEPPRIYVGVSGARGSGSLFADARGGNVEVRRN